MKAYLKKSETKQWISVSQVGISHDQNPSYRESDEDESICIDGFIERSCGLFAVYDGHGGRQVVEFVVRRLHRNLETILRSDNQINPEDALKVHL